MFPVAKRQYRAFPPGASDGRTELVDQYVVNPCDVECTVHCVGEDEDSNLGRRSGGNVPEQGNILT